jgi:PAS domain S-box-containing protein
VTLEWLAALAAPLLIGVGLLLGLAVSAWYRRLGIRLGEIVPAARETEVLSAEQRLRLLEVALEQADDAVVLTTRTGTIVWVNPSFTRLTGYTAEEAVGRTPGLLRSDVHDAAFFSSMWETILSGRVWRGETTNRRKDGRLYTEQQTISPVQDETGEIRHFVAIKQDITQRKQVEELRASLRRTMVHDLRSPLGVIYTALQGLIEGSIESTPENFRLATELSLKHAERMLSLVNGILEVEELKSGTLPLRRQLSQAADLVAESVRLCRPLAEAKRQHLATDLAEDLGPLDVDPVLISRVLQNLIGNAVKFSPEGSVVQIRMLAGSPPDHVHTSVRDEGPGVDGALQPRLFQEFVTGDLRGRGSGLGLAFCRLVVEAHGGRIGVESTPARGACFWFTLPRPTPSSA